MTAINPVVDLAHDGEVAVISVDSPPVNALSQAVRQGLADAFGMAEADPAVKAIVLVCRGRTFIAGADITEFTNFKEPSLAEVLARMDAVAKPTVAAIHGTALGGGLETALCCHFRVAVPSARLGLPEVKLGLLPGSGGTQRLPRLVGVERALAMTTSGEHVPAPDCYEMGLVDELLEEGRLLDGAVAFARRVLAERRPPARVRDLDAKVVAARGRPEIFAEFRKANARRFRGFVAPDHNIRCIEAAVNLPFEAGLEEERRLFLDLLAGPQSAAQRYAFFAERAAGKIPDVPADTPTLPIQSVGIVGAGAMGGGIAMAFANAGIAVTLVDAKPEALERGLAVVRGNYERSAARSGMTAGEVERRMGLITGASGLEDLAQCDLVIEAVFEQMELKKAVLASLDAVARPGAILATNTSYLDVDEIAAATGRPEQVVGLHFFSPAHIMRLLEVVRGAATSKTVVATAMKLARTIGKTAVVAGVAWGFIGNRMLRPRQTEAEALLLDGVMPWDVDRALFDFGFPMGPFAMADLAGLDIGWVRETSRGERVRDVLCEVGRLGQKTREGFYDYDEQRVARPSPVTEQIVRDFAARAGREPRAVSDQEIVERCLYPVVNEGARILEAGKALRASDIDVAWVLGYGWPVWRGGPMYWADQMGLDRLVARMTDLEALHGEPFRPAPLLEKLAAAGAAFTGANP